MIYKLKEKDFWQCCSFDLGAPDTGKSTSLNINKHMYMPEDIGVVVNRMEKQFGCEPFLSTYILVGMDLMEDWNIDLGIFNR